MNHHYIEREKRARELPSDRVRDRVSESERNELKSERTSDISKHSKSERYERERESKEERVPREVGEKKQAR